MLQPKIYVKDKKKVYDTQFIDYKNKRVTFFDSETQWTYTRSFDEVEFMENTGFKDKYGDDVYVGDIVKVEIENETYFEVVKKEKNYSAFTLEDENSCVLFTIDDGQFLETVGNIYENKGLVEIDKTNQKADI